MKLSLGYSSSLNDRVYKLRKILYGLKPSPRAFFGRFSQVMMKYRYSQSNGDHSLFYRHTKIRKVTVLLAYVDDNVIIGNDH